MSEGRVYSSFFKINILLKYDEAKGEDRDEKTCGACFD